MEHLAGSRKSLGRKEARENAKKEKSKKLLRVTCNGLAKFFVNFVLFLWL